MEEQLFLKNQLEEKFNIKSEIKQRFYEDYDGDYFYLYIRGKQNVKNFYKTLEQADSFLLECAKTIFPWKFSPKVFKKDFITSCINRYPEKEWKDLIVPTKDHRNSSFVTTNGWSIFKK